MNSGVVFGVKRFVLGISVSKPVSCRGVLSRNSHAFAIIFRGPRSRPTHKFTKYGAVCVPDVSVGLYLGLARCFSKEITATTAKPDKDILLDKLVSAVSAPDVLDVVGAHHSIMNNRHLIQALKSLFKLRKSDGLSAESITNRPEFLALCKSLKHQIRGLELNEAVDALKIVRHFGLHSSSNLVRMLLEIIRHKVNDLTLQQIMYLDILLKRMEDSRIAGALQIALPLVFEVQLSTKLERTNMSHLADILQYASRKNISIKSLEMIIESLTTLINRGVAMDLRTAKTIIISLATNYKQLPVTHLLQRSLTTLTERIEECTFEDIDAISSKLVNRIAKRHMEFYDEDFMDRCSSYVIKKDCGFHQGTWILKKLTRVGHTNFELLNYLSEKIVADPALLTECKPFTLLTLVTGYSHADYKPANWEIIRDLIMNHRLLEEGQLELPWMKFAVEMASLGCFSSTLLKRIFEEDFLKQYLDRKHNYLDHLLLLLLNQASVALYPTYDGPFPPRDIMDRGVALNHPRHPPDGPVLGAALARGLGGQDYLRTDLFTRFGVLVDHVIIMRKGGFPIPLSPPTNTDDSRAYIEDLEVPANSQIVAILALPVHYYSRNCNRMRGNASLLIRSLEALNLSVVPVSLHLWSEMPEQERIPYLMQAIKHKCTENENVSVQQ